VKIQNSKRMISVLLVALAFAVLAIAPTVMAGGPGVPDAGTVAVRPTTYTFFATAVLTPSQATTYTSSPSRVSTWYAADVFVTADVSGTDKFTVTAQVSADGTNWANASYTYPSNTASTTVITGTSGLTATTSSATSIVTANYQAVINSDTTTYFQMPVIGEYLRFKIENGGTVTPTIKVVLKNTGGR
jgi:hypothetical protein